MAIGKGWAGLFEEQNSLGSVQRQINQEREARINNAFQKTVAAGGNINAARVDEANKRLVEILKGGVQNIFGSSEKGAFLPTDPRLVKAVDDEKHKQELTGMFKDKKMDNPQDFYLMAQEFYKRGFPKQAGELIAQGHGFRKEIQAETGLNIKRTDVEGQLKLGEGNLALAKYKEKFDQSDVMVGRSIQERKLAWEKEAKKIDTALTSRGLDIKSNRNTDLRIIADKESNLRRHLGDQSAGIAQQNANTNRYNVKVNEAYGLKEQSRKKIGQEATIRQADASLALQSQLGLRAADAKDKSNALEGDRNILADYLGRGRLDFDKDVEQYKQMSTDRLYKMARDKMSFDQNLAERGMTVKESLSEHNIIMDGKNFNHTVLTAQAQRDLAQERFEFDKDIGYKSNNRADRIATFKQELADRNMTFTEESFEVQEARLQKHMGIEKHFKELGIKQKDRHKEIDRVLSMEGYKIQGETLKQKESQFARRLFQDRMLGLKGLDLNKQKIQLQRDIGENDIRLKDKGLDIKNMEVKDLKTYRLSSLEMKEKELEMSKTLAQIKAKASLNPKPRGQTTFGQKEHDVLNDIVSQDVNWEKIKNKFKGREEYTGGWASVDADTRREIGDALSGIMAQDQTRTIGQAFDIYSGQTTPSGGDKYSGVKSR